MWVERGGLTRAEIDRHEYDNKSSFPTAHNYIRGNGDK